MKKEKSYEDYRRIMRSLIADQNNSVTLIGNTTVNGVAYKYGYRNFENIVNTKIMESFLGDKKYDIARNIYRVKEEYDGYSAKYKKEMGLKDPKSAIDYLDLRSMFHFYNFRKLVIKNSKLKNKNGVRIYEDLDKLLKVSREQFYAKSDETNMFLNESDIKFDKQPIRSYKTISSLTKLQEEGKNPIEISELTPVSLVLKKQVADYLLEETRVNRSLSEESFNKMKNHYYQGFIAIIKNQRYIKPVENKKINELFSGDLNFRTIYKSKKSTKKELNIPESVYENSTSLKKEVETNKIFTEDEYELEERDGKYYYKNSPESEYFGDIYSEDGVKQENLDFEDLDFSIDEM